MAILVAFRPIDESGQYFRNIDGWWKALANFILDKSPNVLRDGEAEGWFRNTGHIVDAETATAIANRLHQLLEQGVVKRHEIEFELAYPPVICSSCSGTGIQNQAECVACRGRGKLNRSYFTEENVKRFAEFCRHSGGFDIW
jgi:DnaJ-class molecular chaperone